MDAVYKLKAEFRPRASWMMNSTSRRRSGSSRTTDGRYLWQEGIAEGQPSRLLGFPVHLSEVMPDLSANSLSIAFGDLGAAYAVVQRPGIRLLRDPYSAKPYVYSTPPPASAAAS